MQRASRGTEGYYLGGDTGRGGGGEIDLHGDRMLGNMM